MSPTKSKPNSEDFFIKLILHISTFLSPFTFTLYIHAEPFVVFQINKFNASTCHLKLNVSSLNSLGKSTQSFHLVFPLSFISYSLGFFKFSK